MGIERGGLPLGEGAGGTVVCDGLEGELELRVGEGERYVEEMTDMCDVTCVGIAALGEEWGRAKREIDKPYLESNGGGEGEKRGVGKEVPEKPEEGEVC